MVQQTVIYRVAANYGGETSQILLGAALRFWNFSFVPLWGISQGFQPAAGTNYGAKDYDRVKTLTKVFVIAATVLSLIFYIPAELFPAKVLSMFITCLLYTSGIINVGSPTALIYTGGIHMDNNSLSHTKWNCKYHIVFAPKYRRKVAYGKIKQDIADILSMLCKRKGVKIVEAEICPDHVHM